MTQLTVSIVELEDCIPCYIRDALLALLTIPKAWNQTRYQSVDEWIMKMCTYTQFNSSVKKSVITKFTGQWTELENRVTRALEDNCHFYSSVFNSECW